MPVRDAEAADGEEICALIEEHARYEGNDTLVLDRAEMTAHLFGPGPKAWVLIAEPPGEPGTVAGFAFCSWNFSTWQARPGIWLDDLFIRVEWEMQAGNDRAAAFYHGLGAEPVPGWVRYRWPPAS
jgi:hypothetical protein